MLTVRLALQLALLATVIVSGLLIGLSQENLGLSAIGVIGSFVGFVVCDWRKWFSLRGGLANIASIAVLVLAMQGFVEGDGATKLICVSNLLVYLQVVLMFQQKNTRRNWQIMVLSLLQIVVAAIFNLNFEGGLLFILFFGLAGLTMILQSIETANTDVRTRNREAALALASGTGNAAAQPEKPVSVIDRMIEGVLGGRDKSGIGSGNPIAIFDAEPHQERTMPLIVRHLGFWLATCLAFAFLMFFFIPRNSEAWFGPLMVPTQPTGMSMKVDLNQRGKIEQTGERIFRVSFENSLTGEKLQLASPPYFRGTALGQLRIVDGRTSWTAPYDRVYPSVYRRTPELKPNSRRILQRFQMNPTDDPMIFSAMPAFSTPDTSQEIEFCYEVSALTRRQENDRIEKTPFRYELMTRVGPNNEPLEAWPFTSLGYMRGESLERSPGDIEWLTYLDEERYPALVDTAAGLASGFADDERYEMCRRMETFFQLSQDFSYTLDFTDVQWNEGLDPVEDFFVNHKCGHCELYASALVLMLRSQGIPARLVVGYYSGIYDDENQYYVVRSDDAHAWVEAYLRPADCSDEMRREGAAGPGGAWLRLDPTPATELANRSSRENAIEIARNLWQEYVMGLDNQRGLTDRSGSMLGFTDLSAWTSGFESAAGEINNRPALRVGLLAAALFSVMFGVMRTVFGAFGGRKTSERKRRIKMIRNLVGNALGYISPGLKKWVIGVDPDEISTVFYKRLTSVLEEAGHKRAPAQTHREFAGEVGDHYSAHPDAETIDSTVNDLTDLFYSVRFGNADLPDEDRETVDDSISRLEAAIAKSSL